MKRQPEETTERQERKNPKLAAEYLAESTGFDDKGNVIPITGFDELSAELSTLGIDAAAFDAAKPKRRLAMLRKAGVSKDEAAELMDSNRTPTPRQRHNQLGEWQKRKAQAEAWLKAQGLSKPERALVLACVFDTQSGKRPSVRQLEAVTGWKRTRIAQKLKSPTIKRAIADLQSGNIPPTGEAPSPQPTPSGDSEPLPGSKPLTLADCERWAQRQIDRLSKRATAEVWENCLPELLARNTPAFETPSGDTPAFDTPAFTVAMIRDNPAALLTKEGRRLLEALVDLLEMAKSGDSACRILKLPEGSRKRVQEKARKALARLTKSGMGFNFPDANLADCVEIFRCRVAQLQTEYKETEGEAVTVRLEKMHEAHREELEPFKRELQSLLNGDLLKTAARLAEGATRISAEAFEKAYRKESKQWKQAEQAEKFARGQSR